jgi:hypothetical protein
MRAGQARPSPNTIGHRPTMATLLLWQVLMIVNAGFCGWTAFNLFHAKRFLASAIGWIAFGAAIAGAVVSLQLYIMA